MELNPNHPVTAKVHDHWHKIVALLMHKYRDVLPNEIVITVEDLNALTGAFPGSMPVVVLNDKRDGIHLRLVEDKEGQRLARQEGGLVS